MSIVEGFKKEFPGFKCEVMKSHGRLEIIGNHTDHNNGKCLVAGASMGINAAFGANDDEVVKIISEGYRPFSFLSTNLKHTKEDIGTSLGLTKGVMSKMKEMGYRVGGFYAYMDSDIFPGAGVSSSACFESLIVGILSHLYNNDFIDPLTMAKIGQYAEREYFGKPCGLLDQIGTSFGGIDYLHFKANSDPEVVQLDWKLPLSIVLINSGGNHAQLTPLYASIPAEMFEVANKVYHCPSLGEAKPTAKYQEIQNSDCSERAKKRAIHFFEENKRVEKAREAIAKNDLEGFLKQIRESQHSSHYYLGNTMVENDYEHSPQKAVDIAQKYAHGGSIRIMGGGFAGSIICFIPTKVVKEFVSNMAKYYPKESIVEVNVVPGGPSLSSID